MVFDMNAAFQGKANPQTFPAAARAFDYVPYAGQRVQMKGCAPAWAHLIVAAQLQQVASAIDFLIDDGKGGIVVPIV